MRRAPAGRAAIAATALLLQGALAAAQSERPSFETLTLGRPFPVAPEVGAAALGMGGAFLAVADDPSASVWNPAGLEATGWSASIDWSPRAASAAEFSGRTSLAAFGPGAALREFGRESAYRVEGVGAPVDFGSLAYGAEGSDWSVVVQASYRRAVSYAGSLERTPVEVRSVARDVSASGADEVTRTLGAVAGRGSGGHDVYTLSLGFGASPSLSIGLSLDWLRGSGRASETRADVLPGGVTSVGASELEASLRGFGMRGGLLWRPTGTLRIAVVYEDAKRLRLSRVRRDSLIQDSPAALTFEERRNGFARWPRGAGLGIALDPDPHWTVAADAFWQDWSTARYDYERVTRIGGDDEEARATQEGVAFPTLVSLEDVEVRHGQPSLLGLGLNLEQVDTLRLRAGTRYRLWSAAGRRPGGTLRAGALLDRQYYQQAGERAAWLRGWSVGFGLRWPRLSLDAAFVRQAGDVTLRDAEGDVIVATDAGERFESSRLHLTASVSF